jgi:hypothetical protein
MYVLLEDTEGHIIRLRFEVYSRDRAGFAMQWVYKANAANTPAAPPTRAMAPVGRGPAGAMPVLGECAAAPDPETDAPELAAVGNELSGFPEVSTTATVAMAPKLETVSSEIT